MKKVTRFLWLVLIMMLQGCSSKEDQLPSSNIADRPFPVKVTKPIQQDVPLYIETIGNVLAYNSVRIKPRVSGQIVKVFVRGGEQVKIGDALFQIDPVPYQIALERAKANLTKNEASLAFAKQKLERYGKLVERNYISRLTIEELLSNVKTLEGQIQIDQNEIRLAELNLEYTKIVSPINGIVSLTQVDIGNYVRPEDDNPLATILQVQPIYIQFSLPQIEFQSLQPLLQRGERTFKVILPETQKEFEGEVTSIDNQVNLQTGTIQLKGTLANESLILWPGEFVRVRLFIKINKAALLIPFGAVQIGQKGSYVYVVQPDQTVEPVFLKTGEQIEDLVVVDEGLSPDAQVVTDGQVNLRSGAKVFITPQARDQQEPSS